MTSEKEESDIFYNIIECYCTKKEYSFEGPLNPNHSNSSSQNSVENFPDFTLKRTKLYLIETEIHHILKVYLVQISSRTILKLCLEIKDPEGTDEKPYETFNMNTQNITLELVSSLLEDYLHCFLKVRSQSIISLNSIYMHKSSERPKMIKTAAVVNIGLGSFDWAPDDSLYLYKNPKLGKNIFNLFTIIISYLVPLFKFLILLESSLKFRKKILRNPTDWQKFCRKIVNPTVESNIEDLFGLDTKKSVSLFNEISPDDIWEDEETSNFLKYMMLQKNSSSRKRAYHKKTISSSLS